MPEPLTLREYVEYRLNELCREVKRLHDAVDSLNVTRAELAGKASQSSVIVAYVISVVSLIIAVLNLLGRSP